MNPARGHHAVSRGLAHFDRRFGAGEVHAALARRAAMGAVPRLLEIGCGEGRALLELRRDWPAAELHGINRAPWDAMRGSESLADVARYHGVFAPAELASVALPTIHFCDAQRLPFVDGSLDVVISQGAIHYVERKDAVLEEVWRVLAPGGEAFLHVDTRQADAPDFLALPTPRFVIVRGRRRVGLRTLVTRLARAGVDLSYGETTIVGTSIWIRMRRNHAAPLRLGLQFDPLASFDLAALNRERPRWGTYWGYRSVFRL